MLRLPNLGELDHAAAVRIFLCTQMTDMRRSFDRLAEMVKQALAQDPLSGNLFVFRSRGADKLKILYWDGDGLAIWYKRLEEGRFVLPAVTGNEPVNLDWTGLAMLLDGVEATVLRRSKRYHPTRRECQNSSNKQCGSDVNIVNEQRHTESQDTRADRAGSIAVGTGGESAGNDRETATIHNATA